MKEFYQRLPVTGTDHEMYMITHQAVGHQCTVAIVKVDLHQIQINLLVAIVPENLLLVMPTLFLGTVPLRLNLNGTVPIKILLTTPMSHLQ